MKNKINSIISEIVDWNLALKLEDIPDSVIKKAQYQFASVLASVYSGGAMSAE